MLFKEEKETKYFIFLVAIKLHLL